MCPENKLRFRQQQNLLFTFIQYIKNKQAALRNECSEKHHIYRKTVCNVYNTTTLSSSAVSTNIYTHALSLLHKQIGYHRMHRKNNQFILKIQATFQSFIVIIRLFYSIGVTTNRCHMQMCNLHFQFNKYPDGVGKNKTGHESKPVAKLT